MEWHRIRVTIAIGDPELDSIGTFDAFGNGDEWNGFVTPYFDEEEGKKVAAWTEAAFRKFPEGDRVWWDEDRQIFLLIGSFDESDRPREVSGMTIPAYDRPVYGIGAHEWTWEVA